MDLDYDFTHTYFFNSSHFFYSEEMYEDLHGHNYGLEFKIKTNNALLNSEISKKLSRICAKLNNKVIIAKDSRTDVISINSNSIKVIIPDRTFYEFPLNQCYFISSITSSAESLAVHFYQKLWKILDNSWAKLRISLSETFKQQDAVYMVVNTNFN